jgi:hypothetical protein
MPHPRPGGRRPSQQGNGWNEFEAGEDSYGETLTEQPLPPSIGRNAHAETRATGVTDLLGTGDDSDSDSAPDSEEDPAGNKPPGDKVTATPGTEPGL